MANPDAVAVSRDSMRETPTDPLEAVELLECCGEPAEGGICWCQYRREHGAEGLER